MTETGKGLISYAWRTRNWNLSMGVRLPPSEFITLEDIRHYLFMNNCAPESVLRYYAERVYAVRNHVREGLVTLAGHQIAGEPVTPEK